MIVLHTTKYSENSLIIHGYSSDKGRVGIILKGISSSGSKKRGNPSKSNAISVLHPLSILDVRTVENHKGGMDMLKEYKQRYLLNSIRSDITKSAIAMFISELLYRSLVTIGADNRMFTFLEKSILLLEGLVGSAANFHIWFIICYCEELGFAPVGDFGLEFDPFTAEQKLTIERLYRNSFAEAMELPLSGNARRDLIESLIKYMEYHTGSRVKLNSLSVLQTIFRV